MYKDFEADAWKWWSGAARLLQRLLQAQGCADIHGRMHCHVDCELAACVHTRKCPKALSPWLRRSAEGSGSAAAQSLFMTFGEKIWWRVGGPYAIELAALSACGHEDA